MSDELTVIKNKLQKVDITPLIGFSKKTNEIGTMTKMMAPIYLQDFIKAVDVTGEMLAVAIQCDIKADSALKTAESIAYLDKAADYLSNKCMKDTNESRKMYVNIDADVIDSKDVKAKTAALVALLKNKLQTYRLAHDDCKKIAYGDQQYTGYEGM